jgi:ATP/maltotriose-dependent transcriptional regulator MalT
MEQLQQEDPEAWRMGQYLMTAVMNTTPFICKLQKIFSSVQTFVFIYIMSKLIHNLRGYEKNALI